MPVLVDAHGGGSGGVSASGVVSSATWVMPELDDSLTAAHSSLSPPLESTPSSLHSSSFRLAKSAKSEASALVRSKLQGQSLSTQHQQPQQSSSSRRSSTIGKRGKAEGGAGSSKLDAMASVASAHHAAAGEKLSRLVASETLSAARRSVQLLNQATGNAKSLRGSLGQMTEMCHSAVDREKKLAQKAEAREEADAAQRSLAAARNNLGLVLRDVEGILAIPSEADAAEKLLEAPAGGDLNDCDLPAAHARLVALVGASRLAREAILRQARDGDARSADAALNALGKAFGRAKKAHEKLTTALWARVRGMRELAIQRPHALLQAAFVIEMQRKVEHLLHDAGVEDATGAGVLDAMSSAEDGDDADHLAPSSANPNAADDAESDWIIRCRRETKRAVAHEFRAVEEALVSWDDACADGADDARASAMEKLLTESRAAIEALDDIQRAAAPCFPPHLRVDAAAELAGNEHISRLLVRLGESANCMSLGEVLSALELAAAARARRAAMSPNIAGALDPHRAVEAEPGLELDVGADMAAANASKIMRDVYASRSLSAARQWGYSLARQDGPGRRAPRAGADGKLRSAAPAELARIAEGEMARVASLADGLGTDLAPAAATASTGVYAAYAECMQEHISLTLAHPLDVELERVCAWANSSLVAAAHARALADRMRTETALTSATAAASAAASSLEQVARGAAAAVACVVLADPALGALFQQRLLSDARGSDWLEGAAAADAAATLVDYMADVAALCDDEAADAAAAALAERTVHLYTLALVTRCPALAPEALLRIEADADVLLGAFDDMSDEARSSASRALQSLRNLRELLSAEGEDEALLGYQLVLSDSEQSATRRVMLGVDAACPPMDWSPSLVERMLARNPSIGARKARVYCKNFEETWAQHRARGGARGAAASAAAAAAAATGDLARATAVAAEAAVVANNASTKPERQRRFNFFGRSTTSASKSGEAYARVQSNRF